VDTRDEISPTPDAPPAYRWFQRVLPTTILGIALIGLAGLVVPGFREQVELSVSRQPQPFVELYFPTPSRPGPQVICARESDGTVAVSFVVVSHLVRTQALDYHVSVDPQAERASTRRAVGSVRATPGAIHEVRSRFALPARAAYTVSVTLPTLDQQIRARCPGRRP
jgi:hypothetical protein